MNKKEELKIEILMKEYECVGQKIEALFLTSERIIGLGIVVIVAMLTFGLERKINSILLFLPVAFLGVLLYGVHVFTELTSLGGYKRYLEERINTIFEENLLFWESIIAKKRHYAFVTYFLHFLYAFFLVLTVSLSLHTAWQHYGNKVFWFIITFLLGLSIGLIISLVKMYKAFDETYKMAKKIAKRQFNTPIVQSKKNQNA